MKEQNSKPDDAGRLRQKAEELLQRKNKARLDSTPATEADMLKLIHELKVHQVELELQNEELVIAKQKAELAEEKYTELYDFAPSGYLSISKDGEIMNLNFAATRMLGKERSKLIKNRFSLFISQETRSVFNLFVQRVFTSKTKQTCEAIIATEGNPALAGQALPIYVNIEGIVSENDELCHLTIVDITERKKAEEALTKASEDQRILLDNIKTQIWYMTDETTYGAVNKAHADFKGMRIEDMAFKSFYDLYPKEQVDAWKQKNIKVFAEKITVQNEKWLTNALGEQRCIVITNTPILLPDGSVEYVVCTAEDITERKQAEQTRQQLEIAKKTAQFKQNFLANISHEIRTPLSGILGFADILAKTNLNADQKDYLISIQHSGENLRQIINNVLDYSKIEAGKIKLKNSVFKFEDLIHHADNMFKSICKKPIYFEYSTHPDIPVYIKADKNRITQVINNLISNAVKFTEKGKISIKAELIRRDEKTNDIELKVYISDTGKGIAKEDNEKLFKPFSQIDDKDTRLFDGTGLGLSICKDIVKIHGGNIGVDSQVGKGSTFWFTFTAKEATPEEYTKQKQMGVKSRKAKNLRILLVEDVKVNQKVFEITLTSLGHTVEIADNGKEALETYKSGKFDLILMDIQMPVMDGITATQKLKEKYKKLPPIVGLSANAFEGDKEKYMEKGMDEYLTKPLNIEDFSQVIDRLA